MCWVALDRASALADLLHAEDHVSAWQATAQEIRAAVESHGWDPDLAAFTQSFGSNQLDATALLMPIIGFLPPTTRGWCQPSTPFVTSSPTGAD